PGPVPALLPPGEGQPERSPAGARPRAGPLLGIHPRHARMGTGPHPGRPGPRGAAPMTAVRDHDQGGRRYPVVFTGCGTAPTPPPTPRAASDRCLFASRDGWRARAAKRARTKQTGPCPTCKEPPPMPTAARIAVATQPTPRRPSQKGSGRDFTSDQIPLPDPVTPEEEAAVRALLAGQPDADVLADMLGVNR